MHIALAEADDTLANLEIKLHSDICVVFVAEFAAYRHTVVIEKFDASKSVEYWATGLLYPHYNFPHFLEGYLTSIWVHNSGLLPILCFEGPESCCTIVMR